MPSSTLGWNRIEIINKILDTLGRSTDSVVLARLKEDINFAQLAFWKMFDWKWGRKNGVTDSILFTMSTGISTIALDTATISKEMRVTDIDKIFITNPSFCRTLFKTDLRDIRLKDPSRQVVGPPEFYAVSDDNHIELWPIPDITVNGIACYIDGKVMPTFMVNDTDYPDIPIEYQETFIQYLLYRSLSRERDPKMTEELTIFKDMLAKDQQMDLQEVENNLRFKWPEEELNSNSNNWPSVTNTVTNWWNNF